MEAAAKAKPKLSRLALAGFALGLAYPVFLLVVASLGFPGGGLEPPLWFFAFIILAQVSPVSALIFSLIAIVSIRRSRGKLSGLGFAVAGLALSILPLVPMLRRVVLFARIMSRP